MPNPTSLHSRVLRSKGSKGLLLSSGSVRDHFNDYCRSTSIHGVKYLGEEGRPFGERLWWLLIFIVSSVGNFYLIGRVWAKWNNNPVIVSFAETTTPVWQVPFPSVTICPEAKWRAEFNNIDLYVDLDLDLRLPNSTDPEVLERFSDNTMLCDPHVLTVNGSMFMKKENYEKLLARSPFFNETLQYCRWQTVRMDCAEIFRPIITEDGLCYTFNVLNADEMFRTTGRVETYPDKEARSEGWTLDAGYLPETPLSTYPRRAGDAGTKAGLFILLNTEMSQHNYHCRGPIPGYKILLHNPAEIPSVGERYFRVPINQEVLVAVHPDIMTTSESLVSYSPQRRQCYFAYERYLKFFKIYTQRNCELECLTNYTRKICGCISHHMPRDPETPICGGGSKVCIREAILNLRKHEIEASYKGSGSPVASGSCDCLPACASLEYQAQISQAEYDWRSVISAYKDNSSGFENSSLSRVAIFFKDMQFITSRRSELFGPVDFLANCGGLLGLFSGFSLLSLVEIVYYVTLRFWSNVKKRQKQGQDTNELAASPRAVPLDFPN